MNEKTYRFHFYQNRKIYFAISIVVLVVGILASIIIGPKLDIQFAGGSMILYSVEGGQADAAGIETAIVDSIGRDCEVTISQDITTGGEQVNVSFAGNQAMTPEEQTQVTEALQSANPDLGFELLSSSSVEASMAPGSSRSAWCALPSPRCFCWFTSPCASARLAAWPPASPLLSP